MTHAWHGSRLALSGFFFKGRNLHEYAQSCIALGLSGVDLWPWNVNNYSLQEAAAILRSYSLSVMSVNIPGSLFRLGHDFSEPDMQREVKALVELARVCETKFVQMYCASPQSGNLAGSAQQLAKAIREFRSTVGSDIGILLENNLDQRREDSLGLNPSRDVNTLVAAIHELGQPDVRICFDAANAVVVGHDAAAQFRAARELIGLIHVKDCERFDPIRHVGRKESVFLLRDFLNGDFLPTVIGAGALNWQELAAEMMSSYSGDDQTWAVIDPFIDVSLLDWWCVQSVAAWRQLSKV
jgi:sugar phosphate isomerase/epimerase